MILLDTNVLSEVMRQVSNPVVLAWFKRQLIDDLAIPSIAVAEILFGLAIMPAGQRQARMEQTARQLFEETFEDSIQPYDYRAACEFAALTARRQRLGQPTQTADMQIAAIALANGAELATRNTRDFQNCGVTLIDPWLVQ